MTTPIDVLTFFNYRSPYCYLASKKMWSIEDHYGGRLLIRPLGGWYGRSPPERAKTKLPIVRQDVRRWAKRMGIPFIPPPITTDPTKAALGALLASERGLVREYTIEVMAKEWGEGKDIGLSRTLLEIGGSIGLDPEELSAAFRDPARKDELEKNARLAEHRGVFGVPTFVIGDEIFWGQDRISFVTEHLEELRGVI